MLNYQESKLQEKQVLNIFWFPYQELDVSRYYTDRSLYVCSLWKTLSLSHNPGCRVSRDQHTPHLAGTGRAVINCQMVHFLELCKVSLGNLIICCILRITPAEACHGHQNLPTVVPPLSKPRIGFHEALANIPTAAQHLYPPCSLPLGNMA